MKWKMARKAAAAIDQTLSLVASVPLDSLQDRNERRAMREPDYPPVVGSPSEMSEWLEKSARRNEILQRVGKNPWWSTPARRLTQQPVTTLVRHALFAWQRVTRGWDDSATWSLDVHLARTLSEQLDHLAETTHGWPSGDEYPEFEDWQRALHENAALLRAYALGRFDDTAEEIGEKLEREYQGAQSAMRWVAENFGSLWD